MLEWQRAWADGDRCITIAWLVNNQVQGNDAITTYGVLTEDVSSITRSGHCDTVMLEWQRAWADGDRCITIAWLVNNQVQGNDAITTYGVLTEDVSSITRSGHCDTVMLEWQRAWADGDRCITVAWLVNNQMQGNDAITTYGVLTEDVSSITRSGHCDTVMLEWQRAWADGDRCITVAWLVNNQVQGNDAIATYGVLTKYNSSITSGNHLNVMPHIWQLTWADNRCSINISWLIYRYMQLVAYAIARTAFVLNSIVVNQLAIIYSLIAPCNHITWTDSSILLDCLSTQYCQIQDQGTITTLCAWVYLYYSSIRLITLT